MGKIKLVKSEINSESLNFKSNLSELDIKDLVKAFNETECECVSMIEDNYANLKNILTEIKNKGVSKFDLIDEATNFIEETDINLESTVK